MQKVLIIGLGGQGQKYINYFLKNNYDVYGICKTNKTKQSIENRYKIQVSLKYLDYYNINFKYIIIALPPDIQGKVGLDIYKKFSKSIIIIEIPVSFDIAIVTELSNINNVLFFIEEYFTLFAFFLRKIDIGKIDTINVKLIINKNDLDNEKAVKVAYIHLLNNFHGLEIDFSKLKIEIETHNSEDIFYEISFIYKLKEIKYIFNKEKGLFIGNKYFIDNYNFDFVVSNMLKMSRIDNRYYLKNLKYVG
ncbi:MAG: Gfo/Idh/MocA family oxidoreductase [Candidatus Gracilibacteria bacterium]